MRLPTERPDLVSAVADAVVVAASLDALIDRRNTYLLLYFNWYMNDQVLLESALAADPSLVLLVLAVLVVVIFLGRFLLNLAWRLVMMTTTVVVAFYAVTVVLPSVFALM